MTLGILMISVLSFDSTFQIQIMESDCPGDIQHKLKRGCVQLV